MTIFRQRVVILIGFLIVFQFHTALANSETIQPHQEDVARVKLSDLVITEASIIPIAPLINSTFMVQIKVKNQGIASSSGELLTLWLNKPAIQSCGAPDGLSLPIGPIGKGKSKIFVFKKLKVATKGINTLRAFVDSMCATAESKEDNNQFTKTYTIPRSQFTGHYVNGELAGQTEFYTDLNHSLSTTTGALVQAILTVNSFLFTDISVTDLETFKFRKLEADFALSMLQKHAEETENLITEAAAIAQSASSEKDSQDKTNRAVLNPNDVLVTVASGPANQQIKTLMTKYKVGAIEAKKILDDALADLTSQYNDEAKFYDTATRTATLVKEGAALSLIVTGAAVTAGGAAGSLGVIDAATTLITGIDGAIKVSQAGVELIAGKEVKMPSGAAGAIITGFADASEIIGIFGLSKWGETTDRIGNIYTIVEKVRGGLQEKSINLGANAYEVSQGNWSKLAWADLDLLQKIPVTLPGTYRIAGIETTVKAIPQTVKNILDRLPSADKVKNPTCGAFFVSADKPFRACTNYSEPYCSDEDNTWGESGSFRVKGNGTLTLKYWHTPGYINNEGVPVRILVETDGHSSAIYYLRDMIVGIGTLLDSSSVNTLERVEVYNKFNVVNASHAYDSDYRLLVGPISGCGFAGCYHRETITHAELRFDPDSSNPSECTQP